MYLYIFTIHIFPIFGNFNIINSRMKLKNSSVRKFHHIFAQSPAKIELLLKIDYIVKTLR